MAYALTTTGTVVLLQHMRVRSLLPTRVLVWLLGRSTLLRIFQPIVCMVDRLNGYLQFSGV